LKTANLFADTYRLKLILIAGKFYITLYFEASDKRHIIFVHPAEQVTDPHVKTQLSVDCKTAFLLWVEITIHATASTLGVVTQSINQEVYPELVPIRPTLLHACRMETSIDTGLQ
jgi:hypothetical protein